jgi:hypothetical protein
VNEIAKIQMTHRFCTFRPPLDHFVHPPNWLWKNEQLCKQIVWKYDSPKNATYEIQNRSCSIHSLQKTKNGKVKGKINRPCKKELINFRRQLNSNETKDEECHISLLFHLKIGQTLSKICKAWFHCVMNNYSLVR